MFHALGDNCNIQRRTLPLYTKLIKIGNNVRIASGVTFITHDVIHTMLNSNPAYNGYVFGENIGCIEIQDNVFIGAGTTILYGVSIGSNVIIGAGSLVNKDIPSNSVVVGTPARIISTTDEFVKTRRQIAKYPKEIAPNDETICKELEDWCWQDFYKNHF